MGDYDEILKKLAETKLQNQKPEIIDVNKPVFKISDSGDSAKSRLFRSIGSPDAEPVDYAKLNNPDMNQPKPTISPTNPRVALNQNLNEQKPQYSNNTNVPLASPAMIKEGSDRAIASMVSTLQNIDDSDVDSKEATLQEMLDDGDLSDYEKQHLTEWAQRDMNRINMIRNMKNSK